MMIAIATYAGLPAGDEDVPALVAALAELGLGAEPVSWDSPADWGSYDLVVVRNTWDYATRREEFLAWADKIENLANNAEVLRWNTDKRYLRELAEAGIPVVPTLWDPEGLPEWNDYVIKPAISAGAANTARWSAADRAAAGAHLARLKSDGCTIMVQPYLDAVDSAGETALIFIDGEFSHAVRKAAILAPGSGVQSRIGADTDTREQITARTASRVELELAHRVLAAAPRDLLYARVDLVPGPDGRPVLLELELSEPSLFLKHGPGAPHALAQAIARRVTPT
jgi:glutathione synthase/RimK-type ligase-like ATP-grasp enzyme